MSTVDDQVARVAEKYRLAGPSGAAAPTGRVGRRNDPYYLNPPLPATDVVEFERRHAIRLPMAYRRFLTEVGDGDPLSTLYSLTEGYRRIAWSWEEDGDPSEFLARPSRLRGDREYTVAWWDANSGPNERLDQLFGTLPVADGGGAYFSLVVLNGPDAGAVYDTNWDGVGGAVRVADDYLTWREEHLDLLVLLHSEQWPDDSVGADEPTLLDVLAGDPHEYRRMWAALALGRLRTLTDHAHRALARALRDPNLLVRAATVTAIRLGAVGQLLPDVMAAAHDESPLLRARALHTLSAGHASGLDTLARRLLTDPSGDLREHATRVAHEQGVLTAADVARLLDDPDWTVRRQAMFCLPELTDQDGRTLTKALSDQAAPIRWLAIDQVIATGDPHLRALLPALLATEPDPTLRQKLAHTLNQNQPAD